MVKASSISFSLFALLFLLYLFGVLVWQTLPLTSVSENLFSPGYWDFRESSFHALSMFYGTAVVTLIALLIAFPIGLAASICVSEFLTGFWRASAKVTIELLAGVPSVVYGLLGVAYLSRWLNEPLMALGGSSGSSLFTGGVLLAVMILPTLMSFSDDALRCVPRDMRESSWGLGLSKAQTIFHIVLPQAKRGIFGATILAFGRAIGETVAVFLVIGRSDRAFSFSEWSFHSWFQPGQTVTSKLGGSEIHIAYGDTKHWGALMALGLFLWVSIGLISYLSERSLKENHAGSL